MSKLSRLFVSVALVLGGMVTVSAQHTVKGTLVDAETREPLVAASVQVKGTTSGVVTDLDGQFSIESKQAKPTLVFSYIGYQTLEQKANKSNMGTVELMPDAVALGDVVITQSVAIARKTPVALSTLDPVFIEEKIGTKEFPEILKSTPGVYATKAGGGFGDSKINMRGFQSANVAVMVNGVPMNDMEWGGLYWSNWMGLTDVTRSMQTQRGLGASKVSAPSVGGSINIVTKGLEAKKGGTASYAMGNDGYNKMLFSFSTGQNDKGWAFSFLGSKTWGDGYIQGTDFEGYNYFVNLSRRIGLDHQLSFTAFGAPQKHYQRNKNDGLTIQGWQQVANYMKGDSPYKYNPTYGFGLNGERKTSSYNEYHKPQISLNHQWQINHKSSLSSVAYVSIGRGNGYSGQAINSTLRNYWYGASDGVLNFNTINAADYGDYFSGDALNQTYTLRHADGTFAYDQIQLMNQASEAGALMVMSKNPNYHNWYGLVSTYTTQIGKYIDFYGGIDYRYYKGTHKNVISDLYNGKFFIDSSSRAGVDPKNNAAALNPNWVNQKLQVGDVVYRDYDGYVMQEGLFFQAEYNKDKLAAFVAGSLNYNNYWRYDRFYYDAEHAKSDVVSFWGYTAKGGANYNINDNHNVFANIGYISRAPFYSGGAFLSATNSNSINPNAVNEKIFSVEAGYGFHNKYLDLHLNAYYTKWMDKTMARSSAIEYEDGTEDRISINMEGVDAKHMGVELDFTAKPTRWLDVTGMLSVGDWTWDSNATGYYYNSMGQPVANVSKGTLASAAGAEDHAWAKLNLKGVKVGGSAQTTAALGARAKITRDLSAGLDYTYYGNNYADFSISTSDIASGQTKNYTTPWMIPAGGQLDFNASYRFNIGQCRATFIGNIDNVLNNLYIVDAYSPVGDSSWQKAYRVFYAFGRTYSVRLKINF